MKVLYSFLLLSLFLFSSFVSKAQTYFSDPTFNSPVLRQNAYIGAFAEQKDGKVIIAGDYEYINDDSTVTKLTRLNQDRTLDTSFKISVTMKGSVFRIMVQPDGKVIAAGDFTWEKNGVISRGIIRFNSDGSLDKTFEVGTGTNERILDVQLQQDGKILLVGFFTSFRGNSVNYIIRLNEDGSPDNGFTQVNVNNSIIRLRIQKDGKLCIIGHFSKINDIKRLYIARLLSDGSLDESFDPLYAFIQPKAIELQRDGKLILGGYIYRTYLDELKSGLVRLNTDGSVDYSYNTDGIAKYNYIFNMTIQSDDKIVVNAQYDFWNHYSYEGYIFRVNTNGTLDNSFLYPLNRNSYAECMLTLANDKLLLGGGFGWDDNKFLLQLKSDGSADDVTIPEIEFKGGAIAMINQPDKKIIIYGAVTRVDGKKVNKYFRIHENGTLDTTFNPGKDIFIFKSSMQPDGKVFALEGEKLIRLNTDGTHDTSFNLDYKASMIYHDAIVQPDQRILVAVTFDTDKQTIIRFNSDGSLDNTFIQPVLEKRAFNLFLQPDGKILVKTYEFISDNNGATPINRVIRLLPDGAIDNSFLQQEYIGSILNTMAFQPDGKIIVGGYFTTLNGYPTNSIFRLNIDGSLDTTFKSLATLKFDNDITTIYIHADGKIIAHGRFTTLNQEPSNGLVQLNADGSLDSTFDLGIPVEKQISAVTLQSEGRIIVGMGGGLFKYYTLLQQIISFSEIPDKQIGDSPFELTATANSGLPVSFEVVLGPATVAGKVVTLTEEQGPVTIRASQAGDTYNKPAPSVERTFQVQPVLGIEDEDTLKFKIYPNPATGQFTITLDSAVPIKDVYLSNTQGKTHTATFTFKSNNINVFASTISPGIYILHVVTDKREFRKRVVLF